MGKDTFHKTGLFKTPSNLAFEHLKGGVSTVSLGNIIHHIFLTILVIFFFSS